MICSGRALLFGSCLMREPVTIIALPSPSSGAAVAGFAATVASVFGVSAPVGVAAWPVVSLPGGVACAAALPARKNDVAASAVPDASSRTHFALWLIPAIPLYVAAPRRPWLSAMLQQKSRADASPYFAQFAAAARSKAASIALTASAPSGTSLAKAAKTSGRPLAPVMYPARAKPALSVPVLAQSLPASGVSRKRLASVPS